MLLRIASAMALACSVLACEVVYHIEPAIPDDLASRPSVIRDHRS